MLKKLLAPFQKYIDQRLEETHRKLDESKRASEKAKKDLADTEKILRRSEEHQKGMASRLDVLDKKLKKIEWERKASSQSQSAYISMLTSYTAHDLKNNLQNIDNILSFKKAEDITEGDLAVFKSSLRLIRESLDKFSNLSLSSRDSRVSAKSIASNVYHINAQKLEEGGIQCCPPEGEDVEFIASFFSMTTILNNLLINAIKALSRSSNVDRKILFLYGKDSERDVVWFKVYDNAQDIPEDIREMIFDYGFTSYSDGEGIGLSHVKDMCDIYNGKIEVIKSDIIGYTKLFQIELPIGQE